MGKKWDYPALLKRARSIIEKYSSTEWTDYNSHDPGITILEYLCYALTDLSLRTQLPMRDLLARPQEDQIAPDPCKDVLPNHKCCRPIYILRDRRQRTPDNHTSYSEDIHAEDILPSRPLTLNDYRKIIIDIQGVQNAWVTPVEEAVVSPSGCKYSVRGFYKVEVEFEPEVAEDQRAFLKKEIEHRLAANRNLCEGIITSIHEVPTHQVALEAIVHILPTADPNEVMITSAEAVEHFIAPPIRFYSLSEMKKKGKGIDEIFCGPLLEHGFIDDEELKQAKRKTSIKEADLRQILMGIDGIIGIEKLSLSGGEGGALDLPQGAACRFSLDKSKIIVKKGPNECCLDQAGIEKKLASHKARHSKRYISPEDLTPSIPKGDGTDIGVYHSIQNHFPACYGIGREGLPDSASDQRKAQAKQLKAYLLLFEQFMADYLAQLAHVKQLFSFSPTEHTYYVQKITDASDIDQLLAHGQKFMEDLENFSEGRNTFLPRRNRFLDHLLARFAESSPPEGSCDPEPEEPPALEQAIEMKQGFLQQYVSMSKDRASARNFRTIPMITGPVTGLQKRLQHLFGNYGKTVQYKINELFVKTREENEINHLTEFRFYLKDPEGQVLLSSGGHFYNEEEMQWVIEQVAVFGRDEKYYQITKETAFRGNTKEINKYSYKLTDLNGHIIAEQAKFYDSVEEMDADMKTIRCLLLFPIAENVYILEHFFLRPQAPDHPHLDSIPDNPYVQGDPYSFQMSIFLPSFSDKLKNRQLVERTIIDCTPAHITPYFRWLDKYEMIDFEEVYFQWIKDYVGHSEHLNKSLKALLEVLVRLDRQK